jgi:hypothetical protein
VPSTYVPRAKWEPKQRLHMPFVSRHVMTQCSRQHWQIRSYSPVVKSAGYMHRHDHVDVAVRFSCWFDDAWR